MVTVCIRLKWLGFTLQKSPRFGKFEKYNHGWTLASIYFIIDMGVQIRTMVKLVD